jgi:hypothetical protein
MAHGWVQVGEFYDDIDDPVSPRDPAVEAAMKRRWPDLHVFRMHTAWRTPAGTEFTIWFHGVGRVVDNPKVDYTLCGFLRRTDAVGAAANLLERIFEGERGKDGKPGEFLPFTWDRYYELVRDDLYADPNMTALEAVKEMAASKAAAREKTLKEFRAELNDRIKDGWAFFKRQLDSVSDVEWAERRRAEQSGELGRHKARPFVHMRSQ